MDYLIVSDIPTPWREPVYERVHRALNGALEVVYFKANEKRRLWNFPLGSHPKTILPGLTLTTNGTERFFNPGIVGLILKARPRVAMVFTAMKDPSGWLAMATCRAAGAKVALLEDSWLGREKGIGSLTRLARHAVYNWFGDAYIGSSRQSLNLMAHYNRHIRDEQRFLSHLVADNDYFLTRLNDKPVERRFDVLFAGRIAAEKNPAFFAEVCAGIKQRLGKCSVLVIGSGREDLKTAMCSIFDKNGVTYEFAGFIQHDALPEYYAQARLLLLPTSGDCWGVVINEAMISGTPVLTTEFTAAAGELVLHEQNGYVLPLEKEQWISAAAGLLSDGARWEGFSRAARSKAQEFNYDNAAAGIVSAFRFLERKRP